MTKQDWNNDCTLALSVNDVEKSVKWYQDILGFKLLYHVKEISWAEMETHLPGITLGLGVKGTPPKDSAYMPVWGVKDIEKTVAEFKSKKVKFDGDIRTIEGMVKLATFMDLDGNKIMLSQSLKA